MTRLGPVISLGTALVRLYYANSDTNYMNTFHVRSADGLAWSSADLEALEGAFESWFIAEAAAQISDLIVLERISCTDLSSETARAFDKQLDPPVAGTHGGGGLPSNVTIAVKGNIDQRGRGRSGRVYWVGLTPTMVDLDSILSGSAAAIVSVLNALQPTITAAVDGAVLGVCHTIVGGIRPTNCAFSQIFNWLLSDFLLDTQKDRLPGHKKHKRG